MKYISIILTAFVTMCTHSRAQPFIVEEAATLNALSTNFLGLYRANNNFVSLVLDGNLGSTYLYDIDMINYTIGTSVSMRALYIIGEMNGEVYFVGRHGSTGDELWKTDGTQAGTQLVKDINPGNAHGIQSRYFSIAGNRLFFYATTPATGNELWVTDGTEAGTQMVKDINPGAGSSASISTSTHLFTSLGNRLLFFADDAVHNVQLWTSDGTPGGTVLLKEISPGTHIHTDTRPQSSVLGSTLYFSARRSDPIINIPYVEIWATDGTTPGTIQITDLGTAGNIFASIVDTVNAKLVFTIGSSEQPQLTGLYSYSPQQPVLKIAKVLPYSPQTVYYGNRLFFTGYDPDDTPDAFFEVFATNGDSNGTFIEKNIQNGPAHMSSRLLGIFDDYIFAVSTHQDSNRNRVFYFHPDSSSFYQLGLTIPENPNPCAETRFLHVADTVAYIDAYFKNGLNGESLWKIRKKTSSGPLSVPGYSPALFSVFPNPVTGNILQLTGNTDKITALELTDITGKTLVMRTEQSELMYIPVDIPPGIYLLHIHSGNAIPEIHKIIIP